MSISSTKGYYRFDRTDWKEEMGLRRVDGELLEEKEPARQKEMMDSTDIYQTGLGCSPDESGHCITCSDEALPATVLKVDAARSVALVALKVEGSQAEAEVDITLVEAVEPGDILLVHGGLALERMPPIGREELNLEDSRI